MISQIFHELDQIYQSISETTLDSIFKNLQSSSQKTDTAPTEPMVHFPYEIHKYYEVAIQICGSSIIDYEMQTYVLKKHQIMLIDCNKTHRLRMELNQSEPVIMLWIAVTHETIRPGLSTYINGRREKNWALDILAPGGYFLDEIFEELRLGEANMYRAISTYLSAFFMLLLRKLTFVGKIWDSSRKTMIAEQVQTYIRNNISSALSLELLSKLTCVSPNYLCRVFKQITGSTIFEFIQDTRVRLATEYLVSSEMELVEIAEALGFYDQFHFSKTFKRYMGMSPSSYRATYTQLNNIPSNEAKSAK